MGNAVSGRRTLLSGTAVLAAVALIALGSAPAQADETEPDLGVRGLTPVTGITPGSGFGLPVSLLNKGTEELPKAYVTYSFSSGLATAETYSNCLYSTIGSYDEMPERHRAVCTVDQPLKPGVLYGTEKPIGLKAGANALYDTAGLGLWASPPGPDDGGETDPVPGTGAPLTLVERGEATEADRAAHAESGARTDVTAVNTADYALTGAELKGKVGDKVTAQVKFTNKGPARVYRELGTGAASVDVRIPAGTTVTKANGYCSKVTKTHYRCGTSQSWVDEEGGETYSFVLRIDKAVGRTTGKVSFGGQSRPFDRNPANDTAEIVVETGKAGSTGGTTSGGSANGGSDGGTGSTGGSTSGSSGSTGGGSTDTTGGSGSATSGGGSTAGGATPQTGGDLAATGSDSTLPVAGAAGAALLAGGGLFYAMRRRTAARNG